MTMSEDIRYRLFVGESRIWNMNTAMPTFLHVRLYI